MIPKPVAVTFLICFLLAAITFLIMNHYDRMKMTRHVVGQLKELESFVQTEFKQYEHAYKFDGIGIYVINLDRSNTRREFMFNQFHNLNLDPNKCHRVRAYDGKELEHYHFINRYKWYKWINHARLATTLSHLKAIKQAYDNDEDYALILEDDVALLLAPLWECPLMDKLNALPADWEIYRLMTLAPQWKDGSLTYMKPKFKSWGAQGYIVNRKAMKKIVESCFTEEGVPILEPERNNVQPPDTSKKLLVADAYIWYLCKGHMYVSGRQLIFPFNDYGDMNSTIIPTFTYTMSKSAAHAIENWMALYNNGQLACSKSNQCR